MSKYDAVRNRERGDAAKQRVLERTYAPKEEQEQESKYAAVRNRKVELPPTDAEMRKTVLSDTLAGVTRVPAPEVKKPKTVDFKAAQKNKFEGKLPAASLLAPNPFTALQNNMQGKVPAAELLTPNGGEDRRTEYDIREERLRESNAPEELKYLPSVLNKLAFDTAPGKFISRSLAGNSGVTQRDTTGNNVADTISDGINNFVTPFLTPTGAPVGQGLAMAPYETAGQMLSKGIGQKAVNGLARMIPKASPATAQNIARVGLTEGIAGVTQGVGTGLMNGQDSDKEVGMNALYGGVGGFGLGVVGGAVKPIIGRLKGLRGTPEPVTPTIKPIEPTVTEPMKPMSAPKPVEPVLKVEPMKPVEQPKPIQEAPMSDYEKSLQGKKASDLTQDDIDFLLKDADAKMKNAPEPVKAEVAATKEVTESAPKQTQDLFTDLFGEQNLGIVANASRTGGPVDTVDQIVRSGIKNDKDNLAETVKAQLRSVYQNNVNALSPLRKVSDDAYETAVDASRANNIANVIINDKFVNMQGEVIGDSLKDVFGKVSRGQDKNFLDFLNLKRATTRMARNEQVFATSLQMTPEKVAAKIKTLEDRYPGFEAISKDYYKFWDNVRQMGVDEGLLSQKAKEALEKAEPYYVPQNRQFSRSEKPGRSFLAKSAKSSFSGQKAPIQKLNKGGSGRDLVDARKSTTEAVGAWTNAILRNRTMQSIVKSMRANPEKFDGVLSFADTMDNVKASSIKQMNEIIEKDGIEGLMNSLDDDFNMLFNKSKDINLDAENVVRAMVDGEPVYIKVQDVEILKSLLSMGPQTSSVLIDVLSAFSNATKRGATGLMAPVFAIKGATMDLTAAAIQSKTPIRQAGYTVYSIFSGIGDALEIPGLRNWAREYERAGGGYSYALKGENKLNKSVSDITKYPLLSPQNAGKVARKTLASPFTVLEKIGNIAENAPRIAASKLERQALGNEITPENIRKVMNAGRDATVNYSIKGLNAGEWEALAPYTNAAIQGTRRILVAFKKNPVRTTAAIGSLAVVPKLIEYSRFHDDEDYKMIPARDRMRHTYVNKNKDGSFTKIPLDPAYTSFGEMTIEGLRGFKDGDPTAFKGSMDALVNAWTPPMLTGILQGLTKGDGPKGSLAGFANSTVLGPPSALLSNKSFTGAPVVSQSLADRSPKYQYDEKTSSIAKKIGQYTGMSPVETDYIIKSYGGDLARLILPLTSELGKGNTRNTLLRNFITDPAFTNTLSEDFYNAKDKLKAAYADFNEVDAPLPKWYDDSLRKALNSSAEGSISKQLSDLRAYKKILTSDKSLSSKQQTEKIREVQSQINDIYIKINAVLAKQGVIK